MWQTLGYLAAAMIATASLLGWIDAARLSGRGPTREELTQWARTAVSNDVPINPRQWRSVEVVSAPPVSSDGFLWAAATAEIGHFQVESDGRPRRSERWTTQTMVADHPYVIRVEVIPPNPHDGINEVQRQSLQALIEALQAALDSPRRKLRVRITAGL
jgi:hypothetical protein